MPSKCAHAGCAKQPVYNVPGSRTGLFCSEHKEPAMVDVKSRTCAHAGCETCPSYNVPGSRIALFCAEHKEPAMVNVKSKTCANCPSRAWYGHPGLAATACARHMSVGMISYPRKLCTQEGCREIGTHATFDSSNKRRFCEHHVPSEGEYIDFVQRPCDLCHLPGILRNGFCETCDPIKRKTYEHAKEIRVRDVLRANGIVFVSHDKVVEGGSCVRYRPDFLLDAGTHFVIVEVDENQHQERACECEQTRMVNIAQALGLATVFVRYNPDRYDPGDGSKPFSQTKREKVLVEWIAHLLGMSPTSRGAFCDAVYLFFDGCVTPAIRSVSRIY